MRAVILEAMHLSGHKPASQAFFEETAINDRLAATPASDHSGRWREVVARHSDAWLRLHRETPPGADFYGGRLHELRLPALVVHGARDPRTEPGELDAIRAQLPNAVDIFLSRAGAAPRV